MTDTKFSSMSQTTGYTCTAVVELLAQGLFNDKGVFAPESIGRKAECFDFVLSYLAERKVNFDRIEKAYKQLAVN